MKVETTYDLEEMNIRFKKIEDLLKESISKEQPKEIKEANVTKSEVAATYTETKSKKVSVSNDEEPGLTSVRTITYKDETIGVPHFLRDAFLLPQRFPKSVTFLNRLN